MKSNKVFQIELCKEDAQRILNSLELLKRQTKQQINDCKDDETKTIAWLEWSYISELHYDLDCKFRLDTWN
jgi:hypothetical protein